jgi:hypothetical protein
MPEFRCCCRTADVRDDPRASQLALEHLRRAKFVYVDEFRVGQRDGIYTVRWVTPSITAVPARQTAEPTAPPKAKRKAKAAARAR